MSEEPIAVTTDEPKIEKEPETPVLITRNWKELGLFTKSAAYEATIAKSDFDIGSDEHKAFINKCFEQIETSFKDADITKEDLDALCFEIGMEITEENAHKARAIIGRWLTKVAFTDLYALVQGIIRMTCFSKDRFRDKQTFEDFVINNLHLGTYESPYNIQTPMILVFGWCMIIETGVAASRGEKEKKILMPTTLERCIFIEQLGRCAKNYGYEEKYRTKVALDALFNFFINNVMRIGMKQPHPSEAAYLTCTKRSLLNAGGDPFDHVYRCLDNDSANWNLFSFIVEDNV